jgi:hypothetical protein
MRVDAAAVFFSVLGLLVFVRAESRSARMAAGALFVLALYCKQTMIAAPIGAIVTLLLTGAVAEAFALTGVIAVLGLTVLGALTWSTDGEFVRHLFLYNQNPYYLRQLLHLLAENLRATGIVTAFALAAPLMAIRASAVTGLRAWLRVIRESDAAHRTRLCLCLSCLAAFLLTFTAGKVGANRNYFLEWNVMCSILAGITTGEILRYGPTRRMSTAGVVVLLLLGLFGIDQLGRTVGYVRIMRGRDAALNARAVSAGRAFDEIKAARGPVFSEDMVLLAKANKDIPWEPATITQLAATGLFDETRTIETVEARWFDLIVAKTLDLRPFSYSGPHVFYSERIREAIRDSYEVRADLGSGYTILQPRR